jgi:hypothetical protein
MCLLRGRFVFFPCCVRFAVSNVLSNRVIKELSLLRDNPNLTSQVVASNLPHIDAVNQDCSLLRVHESRKQIEKSRFSGSVFANYCNDFSGRNAEAEVVQSRWSRVSVCGLLRVRERHIFKANIAAVPTDDLRFFRFGDFGFFTQDFGNAIRGDSGPLEVTVNR